ncbi:MAG TPA: sulfur oxidation c-type cytochrome SoxA [Candidatus Sulfotelmatobacter sp.]|nr:sulfur oxidation c-type cytochrome SoxA [Candidatus Sulfotelmatobacter sp.]
MPEHLRDEAPTNGGRRKRLAVASVAALSSVAVTLLVARAGELGKYQVGSEKSGYLFAARETRDMQDDDFNNPGFLWVERGEAAWNKVEGAAGKSCAACHGAVKSMRGVAAGYPKMDAKLGKLLDLEQRINHCRTDHMQAPALAWESDALLGLTTLVKLQSRGMPVKVALDGPAKSYWERGKAFYYTRRGQLGLACNNCHEDNEGKMLRADPLSQGQSNGFPTYRLAWQKLGSIQRRFQECNSQVRAEPYPLGADEYVALELYVASRGQGLPVETPSVRR